MFLHLGEDTDVIADDIIGIFDIDNTTVSAKTRDFLKKAQNDGNVINVSDELPKSFVITKDKKVYISLLSVSVLEKRAKNDG